MARVTLTFDNGPDPVGTPRVLEVLRRRGVTARFFVLGRRLDAPGGLDLARRVVAEGHRLGNHSYSHETPLGLDPRPDAVERELGRTDELLADVPSRTRLFRPFGGGGHIGPHLLSPAAVRWLSEREHTVVLWSSVPGDFADPHGWVDAGLADVATQDHALLVLHDAVPDAMLHLDTFVGALLDAGHELTDELPERCLPIVRGEARPGLEAIVQPTTRKEMTA